MGKKERELQAKAVELQKQFDTTNSSLSTAKATISNQASKIDALTNEAVEIKCKLAKYENDLTSEKILNKNLMIQIEEYKVSKGVSNELKEIERLEKELTDANATIKNNKSELEGLKNFRTSASATIEKLQKELEKAESNHTVQAESNDCVHDEIIANLEMKVADLQLEIEDTNTKREEIEARAKVREMELESLLDDAGNNVSDNSKTKSRKKVSTTLVDDDGLFEGLTPEQLEARVFEQSKQLVEQANKNQKLSDKLQKLKIETSASSDQVEALRENLVKGINPSADPKNFANVDINDLLRIRIQKSEETTNTKTLIRGSTRNSTRGSTRGSTTRGSKSNGANLSINDLAQSSVSTSNSKKTMGSEEFEIEDGDDDFDDEDDDTNEMKETNLIQNATAVDKEIRKLKKDNRKLQRRLSEALEGLRQADQLHESLLILRDRNEDFAARIRTEKNSREKANGEVAKANDKVIQLSEHIEKLMVHLKHEAAAKVKANSTSRQLEKEGKLLRQRVAALNKCNAAKDRVIAELKEGSRILEDQLRLMDDKYIELRNKLDWTRNQSKKEVAKIQKEANELRKKWLHAGGMNNVTMTRNNKTRESTSNSKQSIGPVPGKSKNGKLQPLNRNLSMNSSMSDFPEMEGTVPSHLPWSDSKIDSLEDEYDGY